MLNAVDVTNVNNNPALQSANLLFLKPCVSIIEKCRCATCGTFPTLLSYNLLYFPRSNHVWLSAFLTCTSIAKIHSRASTESLNHGNLDVRVEKTNWVRRPRVYDPALAAADATARWMWRFIVLSLSCMLSNLVSLSSGGSFIPTISK